MCVCVCVCVVTMNNTARRHYRQTKGSAEHEQPTESSRPLYTPHAPSSSPREHDLKWSPWALVHTTAKAQTNRCEAFTWNQPTARKTDVVVLTVPRYLLQAHLPLRWPDSVFDKLAAQTRLCPLTPTHARAHTVNDQRSYNQRRQTRGLTNTQSNQQYEAKSKHCPRPRRPTKRQRWHTCSFPRRWLRTVWWELGPWSVLALLGLFVVVPACHASVVITHQSLTHSPTRSTVVLSCPGASSDGLQNTWWRNGTHAARLDSPPPPPPLLSSPHFLLPPSPSFTLLLVIYSTRGAPLPPPKPPPLLSRVSTPVLWALQARLSLTAPVPCSSGTAPSTAPPPPPPALGEGVLQVAWSKEELTLQLAGGERQRQTGNSLPSGPANGVEGKGLSRCARGTVQGFCGAAAFVAL